MSEIDAFDKVKPYLVEAPKPLIGAETIQLILLREILDYTVLRTEETRELNTVHTPFSVSKTGEQARRVAFLATKQKASESRELEHMLRTAIEKAELKYVRRNGNLLLTDTIQSGDDQVECYLKDNLCMQCPRCGLFGATSTVAGQQERANIKHRIEYSTAFSLLSFDNIGTGITFNAINDRNQTTGQALGQRYAIQPATLFPSVITLKSVTKEELILAVKTLLACKSYGAESRIGGDARNIIWGIAAGWEEIVTSLELALELADNLDSLSPTTIEQILKSKYKTMAGNPNQVVVLNETEVNELIKACSDTKLDRQFLEKVYGDIAAYRSRQLAH